MTESSFPSPWIGLSWACLLSRARPSRLTWGPPRGWGQLRARGWLPVDWGALVGPLILQWASPASDMVTDCPELYRREVQDVRVCTLGALRFPGQTRDQGQGQWGRGGSVRHLGPLLWTLPYEGVEMGIRFNPPKVFISGFRWGSLRRENGERQRERLS